MKVIEYLKYLRECMCIPSSREGNKLGLPSNAELRRWCRKGSVKINGRFVAAGDEVTQPVELVFFEGSRSQVTMPGRKVNRDPTHHPTPDTLG